MTSTTNKLFHTYENVGFEDRANDTNNLVQQNHANIDSMQAATTNSNNNGGTITMANSAAVGCCAAGITVNKTAIESPFQSPIINGKLTRFITHARHHSYSSEGKARDLLISNYKRNKEKY